MKEESNNKRSRIKKTLADFFLKDKKKQRRKKEEASPKYRYASEAYEGILNRINKMIHRFDEIIERAKFFEDEKKIVEGTEKLKEKILEYRETFVELKAEIESRKKTEDVLGKLVSGNVSVQDPFSALLDVGMYSYKFFNKKKREDLEQEFIKKSDILKKVLMEYDSKTKDYLNYLDKKEEASGKRQKPKSHRRKPSDTEPPAPSPFSGKPSGPEGEGGDGSEQLKPKEPEDKPKHPSQINVNISNPAIKQNVLSGKIPSLQPPLSPILPEEPLPTSPSIDPEEIGKEIEERLNKAQYDLEEYTKILQNEMEELKKQRGEILLVPVIKKTEKSEISDVLEKKLDNIEKNTNPIEKLPDGLESIKKELSQIKEENERHHKTIEDAEKDREYEKRDIEDRSAYRGPVIPVPIPFGGRLPGRGSSTGSILIPPSSGGGTAGGGGGGYSGGGGTGGGGAAPAEGWSGGGIAPIVGGVAGALGGAAISKGRKLFNFIRGGIGKIYKGIGNNNVGKIASGFRKAPVGNFLYNVGQKIGSTKIGSKLGAVGKFLGSKGGKLVPFLAPGIYLASQMTGDKPLKEKLLRGGGGVAGMLLGQMGGRLLGGMAGSIIPFAGTAIGSTIGSILGGSAGAFIGESLGGKLYNALFGEKESAPPGSDRSPWKNERKINLGVPNRPSRTIESTPSQRIEGGKIKENSQLEKMKSVLGEKLAVEAAHLAATEGGMDKEGNLKTDSINKLSQAAGMFQFLPGVAVDTIRRMDDQDLKDKFQKYIDEFEKNKKLSSSSREEVAKLIASLDETQQSSIYKKYIEPLATAKGGYDKLTAEDLKSYGFSPAAEMSGSDENTVVYRKGTPAYDQNTFLDLDKDGNITKGEIRQYSEKIIKNREVAFNKFLRKNVEGGKAPTPQAPTDQPIQRQREAGTELASARPPATRESEGEAMRPAPVLVASRRVITPETNELARESSIRTETAQTSSSQQSTIINVDNRSTVTRQSSSSQRMEIATVRNTDTTIQKALEKSYFA